MKLDLFTWIPVLSTGMTILLFAVQLNAAGVCIVCPPGHTCPAGETPVLGGAGGSLLRRTSAGTEWAYPRDVLVSALGTTGLEQYVRRAMCPIPPNNMNDNVIIHARCSGSQHNPSNAGGATVVQGHEVLGRYCWCRMENRAHPGCYSSMVFRHANATAENCASNCLQGCSSLHEWREAVRW